MQVRCYKEPLQQAIISILENAIEAIEDMKYVDTRHIEIIRYFPGRPGIRAPGPRATQKQ